MRNCWKLRKKPQGGTILYSDTLETDPYTLLHLRKDGQDVLLPVTALLQCLEIALADCCIPPFNDGWLDKVLRAEFRVCNLDTIPEP